MAIDLSALVWDPAYAVRALELGCFRREDVSVVDLVRLALDHQASPEGSSLTASFRGKTALNYAALYAGRELIADRQDGHDDLSGFSPEDLWALRRLGRDAGRAWKPVFDELGGPAFLAHPPHRVARLLKLELPIELPKARTRPSPMAERA